jgi:subtilase family serine protease
VRSFLERYGLAVTDVPANGRYVAATGTVAEAEAAFATSLRTYRLAGHLLRAAAGTVTVPRELAGTVLAVSGLADRATLMRPRIAAAPPPDVFVNAPPCGEYYGEVLAKTVPRAYGRAQPYVPCGYLPAQLRAAYGVTRSIARGIDGSGVRVAVTGAYAAPTIEADADTYAVRHGVKPFGGGQFRQLLPAAGFQYGFDDATNGDLCGEQGWYGEETLDVEAVHTMAPGASLTYVASRSCDAPDFADALNAVVDGHLADIVTNSWGGIDESNGSPSLDLVYQQIFYQAALQGMGMYFSSGDSGDGASANNGTPTVEAPANSSLVTAVGGTSLALGRGNTRVFETGWSTGNSTLTHGAWTPPPPGDFLYGAGGGTSQVFAPPAYQRGIVPRSIAQRYSKDGGRAVPDISVDGDPNTGMRIGETQTFPDGSVRYSEFRIGGTSLASPLFAGIMAIADQVAGRPHGFANPALYALYGTKGLRDIQAVRGRAIVRNDYLNRVDASGGVKTSLRTFASTVGTILRTRKGYDDVTGVGTPNGEAFIAALARRR